MITLDFLITAFIVVLIPGTGVLFTISTGLTQGRLASIYAAFGCTLGIVPHLLATVLGLAAVLHTSALAFQVLKYAGVAYLFYLAYSTWQDKTAFQVTTTTASANYPAIVIKSFLLNILNPKLSIFFLAFLPQFVRADAQIAPLMQLFVLSAVFMSLTFIVFVIYGWLAHGFRQIVIESTSVQQWLKRSFAAAFVGLGFNLATTRQ